MADTTLGPKGWTPERIDSLKGNTYLITGANTGAGFQAARAFLAKGADVVMLPQRRQVRRPGKDVEVHVCHPGASRTNLLKDTASTFNKILWATISPLIAQSAEKGSWPEVMCATEEGLQPETLYGPTKRADTVGPVGELVPVVALRGRRSLSSGRRDETVRVAS